MNTFYKINKYLKGYYFRLILNLLLNAMTALASIFSFLMLMPFLQLIFKADAVMEVKHPVYGNYTSVQQYLSDVLTFMFAEMIQLNGKMIALGFICIVTLCVFFIKNLSRYLALVVLAPVKTGLASNMRERLFEKITKMDSGNLNHYQKGDLVTNLTHDIQEIEYGILFFLEVVLREPITIVITFVVMLFISVKLTLFVLIILPISGYLIGKIGKQLKKTSLKAQKIQGNIATAIDEMINNNQVIKSNNIETAINEKFRKINTWYYRLNTQMLMRRDLSSPLSEFFGMTVVLVVLFMGGSMILKQQSNMPAELFITYIVIFSQIIQPAKVFSNAFYFIQKGMASLERIETVLKQNDTLENTVSIEKISDFKDKIRFNQVSFGYQQKNVLEQVTFDIKKGEKIALVGVSGSGKTTVTKLLMRFYDTNSGNIFIDNKDIKNINLANLRDKIAWVPQQHFLFNDSIAYNISLAEIYDEEQMFKAIHLSNLEKFVQNQPQKINTKIGDGGMNISGGEQQRIAIARAIYKNAPIVILDEATAHLDSQNENIIQNSIQELMKEKTVIVIAHRLATVQSCDKIIVLDNGKIKEQGTHQDLIKNNSVYAELVKMQQIH